MKAAVAARIGTTTTSFSPRPRPSSLTTRSTGTLTSTLRGWWGQLARIFRKFRNLQKKAVGLPNKNKNVGINIINSI